MTITIIITCSHIDMQTHTGQILAHTITKVKTLTRKLGLGFNL